MTPPCLILVALATSGLRPNYDQPLELGLLAVSRDTFEPVDMLTSVLKADPSSVLAGCDEYVANMHAENGLFEAMLDGTHEKSFDDAAKLVTVEAVDFIERNGATGQCESPLICFGTDWTRRWLSTRFGYLATQFKGELDMTTLLAVLGRVRQRGNGRAESTLLELYDALKGLRS